MSTSVKIASPENELVVSRSRQSVTANDKIDWRCKLFDSGGFEHELIAFSGIQTVTKYSFCYAIWDRKSGVCISGVDDSISNTQLTELQRQERYDKAMSQLCTY